MNHIRKYPAPEVTVASTMTTQRKGRAVQEVLPNIFRRQKPDNLMEEIEFFVPVHGLDIKPYLEDRHTSGIHHLARYHWAKRVIGLFKPKTVLDIACGAGYGSYMMAEQFPEIAFTGGDYDRLAVEYAITAYNRPNLKYIEADIVTWLNRETEKPLGQFDMIISFDTIEHLLHREIAFISLAENLSEDGCLLFSTPSGANYNLLNPSWSHHKLEFSHGDLGNLMSRFFGEVYSPQDDAYPYKEYWEELNKDELVYLNKMNPLCCKKPIQLRNTGIYTTSMGRLYEVKKRLIFHRDWNYLRYIHLREGFLISHGVQTILSIAAGRGLAELALAIEFPNIHLHVTDIVSSTAVSFDEAAELAAAWKIPNITFEHRELFAEHTEAYDMVVSIETIQRIENEQQAVAQICSQAKKYVFFLVPYADSSTNADPLYQQMAWEQFKHYRMGYSEQDLRTIFPEIVAIRGCYWKDFGAAFRNRLEKASGTELVEYTPQLIETANEDIIDKIPEIYPDAHGIWILSRSIN